MASAKTRAVARWTASIALALLFLASASGKLANGTAPDGGDWDAQFVAWGYPAWFRVVVGASEAVGAVLLLLPVLRPYGAAGLAGVMAGAVVTHLANGEAVGAAVPAVLALALAGLAWSTRPTWLRTLLARPTPRLTA